MKVLWLTKGLGRGGAERLLVDTAARLQRDSIDVEVAYVLPFKDAMVPDLQAKGVPVHCLGARRLADLRWLVRLRRLLTAGRYDVVHTHAPAVAAGARLVTPRPSVLVHTEHNVWDRYRLPTRWANLVTFPRNRAVIAVSHGVEQSIRRPRWVPARRWPPVEVIIHGVEHERFRTDQDARAEARRRLGVPTGVPVIGTVANFTPKKDQRTLLAAFAQVHSALPDARLVLVGAGPLEGQLRDQKRALGLTGAVVFAGSRDDVTELLPGFDVFTLSSLHEGLSIALVEAMAARVPVVVTAVGGIPEVVTDGVDGLLVPPADPPALADALRRVLTDPGLRRRLADAGWERSQAFGMAEATERTERVYRKVLG